MGKGDKRSRRGKIFAGSFGKSRPKNKKEVFVAAEKSKTAAAPAEKKTPKPRVRKKTEAA
jgi:30S ribosomal protein S31